MEVKKIKEPGADPAPTPADPPAPEPEPAAPAAAEPAAPALTEESIRKICEEIIGSFLDRFTNDKKEDEPPPPKEDDSFDYQGIKMNDRELEINQLIEEFNNKLDKTSGQNREQMKKQLQADFDLEISLLLKKEK